MSMAIKPIKLELGTIYQKEVGGTYYFRYQINGERKAVSLKTSNQKDAIKVWKRKSARRKGPFLKRFLLLASGFCIID